MEVNTLRCRDTRPCFAREVNPEGRVVCMILSNTYLNESRDCPFCKPEREVTGGMQYPYNANYSERLLGV